MDANDVSKKSTANSRELHETITIEESPVPPDVPATVLPLGSNFSVSTKWWKKLNLSGASTPNEKLSEQKRAMLAQKDDIVNTTTESLIHTSTPNCSRPRPTPKIAALTCVDPTQESNMRAIHPTSRRPSSTSRPDISMIDVCGDPTVQNGDNSKKVSAKSSPSTSVAEMRELFYVDNCFITTPSNVSKKKKRSGSKLAKVFSVDDLFKRGLSKRVKKDLRRKSLLSYRDSSTPVPNNSLESDESVICLNKTATPKYVRIKTGIPITGVLTMNNPSAEKTTEETSDDIIIVSQVPKMNETILIDDDDSCVDGISDGQSRELPMNEVVVVNKRHSPIKSDAPDVIVVDEDSDNDVLVVLDNKPVNAPARTPRRPKNQRKQSRRLRKMSLAKINTSKNCLKSTSNIMRFSASKKLNKYKVIVKKKKAAACRGFSNSLDVNPPPQPLSKDVGMPNVIPLRNTGETNSTSRDTTTPSIFGSNFSNPGDTEKTGLRPIVIDGSNVAIGHGNGAFSSRGLEICVNFFVKKGHKVYCFVPQFRRNHFNTLDPEILNRLERSQHLIFTPSRRVDGRNDVPYDDRYVVQTAAALGGVIVSKDNFRDILAENPHYGDTIKNRLLMFTWVGDMLMFPQDPLGRRGPNSLEQFLRF